jgi:glutamate-1-semialdehyde 2,1-aminomutase
MAATKATLTEACTRPIVEETIARNHRLVEACQAIIDRSGIPAHTVEFGAKGCITWLDRPVRNYRDYKASDFDLAFAQWMHGINRGVLLPPGLDEQWLISVMHDDEAAMHYAHVFEEFVDELTA